MLVINRDLHVLPRPRHPLATPLLPLYRPVAAPLPPPCLNTPSRPPPPPPHCPFRCCHASSARAAWRLPARRGSTRSVPSRRHAAAPPRAACGRSAAVCARPRRRMHPLPPLRQPPPPPPLRQPLWPLPRHPPPRRPRHSPPTPHRLPPPWPQRRRRRQRWLRLSARRLPHEGAALRAARCSGQSSCWRPLPVMPAGTRVHDARMRVGRVWVSACPVALYSRTKASHL